MREVPVAVPPNAPLSIDKRAKPTGRNPTIDLVTVASYPNPQEASLAKDALLGEGIAAYITGAETVNTLWHVGSALGGVKLQVAQDDVQRAEEVLNQSVEKRESTPAWICPDCGSEVDAGFEVCWSCGFTRETGSASLEVSRQRDARSVVDSTDPAEEPADVSTAKGDEIARRAWRAAVIGIGFTPLLLYSAWLIVRAYRHELSPAAERGTYGAIAIIAGMMICICIMLVTLAH